MTESITTAAGEIPVPVSSASRPAPARADTGRGRRFYSKKWAGKGPKTLRPATSTLMHIENGK
ncbi:hypothetical protein QQ045_012588 [Rhodiola kirilowii]